LFSGIENQLLSVDLVEVDLREWGIPCAIQIGQLALCVSESGDAEENDQDAEQGNGLQNMEGKREAGQECELRHYDL